MQRMTDALSRMLNDPSTRLAMRTLGDREASAIQRSQFTTDEGEEITSDTNNNPTEEVQPEINPDRTDDEQMHDNDASKETHRSMEGMDESAAGSLKQVPDITVEHCSQTMATDHKELDLSSHEDKNDTSNIETENKSDNEQTVLGASAPENINEQSELSEKCSVDKTGL